jgi:hypothetical protein
MSECICSSTLVAGSRGSCGGAVREPCGARADAAATLLAARGCQVARSRSAFLLYLRSPCARVLLSTRPAPADLGSRIWFPSASNLDGNTRKKIGYNMSSGVVRSARRPVSTRSVITYFKRYITCL